MAGIKWQREVEKKNNEEFCVRPPRDLHSLLFLILGRRNLLLFRQHTDLYKPHHGIVQPTDFQPYAAFKYTDTVLACQSNEIRIRGVGSLHHFLKHLSQFQCMVMCGNPPFMPLSSSGESVLMMKWMWLTPDSHLTGWECGPDLISLIQLFIPTQTKSYSLSDMRYRPSPREFFLFSYPGKQ